MSRVPLWPSVPLTEPAATSNRRPPRLRFWGPTDSLHPRATASNPETPTIFALIVIFHPHFTKSLKVVSVESRHLLGKVRAKDQARRRRSTAGAGLMDCYERGAIATTDPQRRMAFPQRTEGLMTRSRQGRELRRRTRARSD